MPDQDAAHIAFNMARVISKAVTIGPILMGAGRPAHVLTPSATVRRVVNMTAISVVDAQQYGPPRSTSENTAYRMAAHQWPALRGE
jgi:malate dehydrogenase (oxaloacetate-decarboxylating)(NADP+)